MHAFRPKNLRRGLVVAILALLPAGVLVAPSANAAVITDGSAAHRAAASCWEIKQDNASATDGRYWLLTPQLEAPAQFYCDMSTDGGGWVLVGRGREDWVANHNGRGTINDASSVVTGTQAFTPAQLDAHVIDALNGGRRIDAMDDGVRLRRATNTAGTSWQEVRFKYKSRDRWSWAFGAGHPITSFNVGGSTGTNRSTRDFGPTSGLNRVWTYGASSNSYVRGFHYGQGVSGSTSSTSFLYSEVGGYATPFTQVFIRPKLRTSDLTFPQIPDSGTNAQTGLNIAENGSLTQRWGVTGLGNGGSSENASEVQAFAQIGNTMYVGGNFTTVQKGADASGSDKVSQAYLAAFDADTGDWISTFRPTFNNHVKSLAALPGGRIAVGGEFTNVNGSARSGLIVLNAQTGGTDPSWTTNLQNRVSGGSTISVRALGTDGTWLYVGGAFSHFIRGSQEAYALRAGRLALSNGAADASWNPQFNGTVTDLDVASGGQRVYFSGYFTTSRGAVADRGAAMSTASGAAQIPWQPTHSTSGSARYQQAVEQLGSRVWLGGSQHNMFSYDTSSFALNGSSITRPGGDIQAMAENGDNVVYAGCHCPDWNYDGTTQYDGLSIGSFNVTWKQADKIYDVGAWDNSTGLYIPDFTPRFTSRGGRGAWALKMADDGTLWAGGTFTAALKENGANQWVGGFARFRPRPHTAPAKPSNLEAGVAGNVATVSWNGPSGVDFEVLRNDRVVAVTDSREVQIPDSVVGDRFFVRSSDGRGNRSASTSVTVADGTAATVQLLDEGESWRYFFDNTVTVPAAWKQPSFDDSSWRSGNAPLGWGSGPITTNIDVPAGQTRALTSYHRTTFDVDDPSALSTIVLATRADDGLVVYVNGTEVGRSNLPAGTITPNTYALTARSTSTAIANPVTIEVPASLLTAGPNTVAAEVHSNYRSTPSTSFDAAIEAQQ